MNSFFAFIAVGFNRRLKELPNEVSAKFCRLHKLSKQISGDNLNYAHLNRLIFFVKKIIFDNMDKKLDLISKLSLPLKQAAQSPDISLQSLFGAYQSDETAEEIIAAIKASRVSNRAIETL
jgi:hypothetical protein